VPKRTTLQTDVCVIGGGAAGITVAKELEGSRLNVTLLESGGFQYEQKTQALYDGRSIGIPYEPLDAPRLRFLGGTTNHWGGYCRPFEEADFEARAGIRYTGWPLSLSEITPFYRRAVPILTLPTQEFDLAYWLPRDPYPIIKVKSGPIVNRLVQVVDPKKRSFGLNYKNELRRTSNVKVVLHANVTDIATDEHARTATTVTVSTLGGHEFKVAARVFVLAAGAIENARILLSSTQRSPAGLGNQNDVVGRFFMDHGRFVGGFIFPEDPATNVAFYDTHPARGGFVHGYLGTTKAYQLEHGLLDVQFRPQTTVTSDNDGESFGRKVMDVVNDLNWQKVVIPGSPVPLPYLEVLRQFKKRPRSTFSYLRGGVVSIGLTTRFEPAPNPDSRITLAKGRDELGMRHSQLSWQLSDFDKHNVRKSLEVLAGEIGRAGIGRVRITFDDKASGWPHDLGGGQHLMGTTRMSRDPKEGVVDRNLLVHGMSNLFIGGSSVFPTASGATPTFMITALAIRLADHLKGTLG
jgi:choline dehydrogenase-like flavoprotein